MNSPQVLRCYAVRRLNPFLGVVQIIETETARASTSNGLVWHIELLVDVPAGWGSLGSDTLQKEWYLHALWSERDGLVELPTGEMSKCLRAVENSERMVQAIAENEARLPFALADCRELWLLDEARRKPLALLFAMLPRARAPSPEPRYWKGCLGREGVSGQRRFPEIDRLEAEVRKRAGFNLNKRWVTRDIAHTNGLDSAAEQSGEDAFPVYGVSEEWPNKAVAALVQRYIDWIAPSLLTLPSLRDSSRARLEARLGQQARSIEYHWRLYPKVLDAGKITAARVQARMRLSQNPTQ